MRKKEVWKKIPGTFGKYSVSNIGNVIRSKKGHNTHAGRKIKPWKTYGYFHVTLNIKGMRHKKVASLVALCFIGKRPNGCVVNHKNGIKTDNRVANLEYISQSDNILHSYRTLGTKPSHIKLTIKDVLLIRKLYTYGVTKYSLSVIFSVSYQCVSRIINKTTWKLV